MGTTQLYIPKKCKVGFNLRGDTYTGKLGYIIYHDGKVWRKETSWESWRQKEGTKTTRWNRDTQKHEPSVITGVEPIEFDNVPTSGFVLNKKVGGHNSGWNHRQTYSRVYDPRGWEFEITVPNLLYILQECSSFKGKGLEGEFVYSWDGKDLVLLPATSPDYIACEQYTDLQSKKVGKKEMVEGCTYLTSKQKKLLYLGKYKVFEREYMNRSHIEENIRSVPEEKMVFIPLDDENRYHPYEFLGSLSSLKLKLSDDIHPQFADFVDEFLKSPYFSPVDHLEVVDFDDEFIKEHLRGNRYTQIYLKNNKSICSETDLNKIVRRVDINDKIYTVRTVSEWNRNGYYWYKDNNTVEGKFTIDELKEKYGMLVRVYKSGLKKTI